MGSYQSLGKLISLSAVSKASGDRLIGLKDLESSRGYKNNMTVLVSLLSQLAVCAGTDLYRGHASILRNFTFFVQKGTGIFT